MIYTFRAETCDEALKATQIALATPHRTVDIWEDDSRWWLKVWTNDRDLPRRMRPYASLERREW